MNALIALASVLAVGLAMSTTTTHRPHQTHKPHEPTESETILFNYVPKTHNLIIKQRSKMTQNCYVATLTEQEKMDVHTDSGLRTIELKYLQTLDTATSVTMDTLDPADVHACGRYHNHTISYFTL